MIKVQLKLNISKALYDAYKTNRVYDWLTTNARIWFCLVREVRRSDGITEGYLYRSNSFKAHNAHEDKKVRKQRYRSIRLLSQSGIL